MSEREDMQREMDTKALVDAVWLAMYLADRYGEPSLSCRLLAIWQDARALADQHALIPVSRAQ